MSSNRWSLVWVAVTLWTQAFTVTLAEQSPSGRASEEERIACKLTDRQRLERKKMAEKKIMPFVEERVELEAGVELYFSRQAGRLADLAEFVELESECCPFLDFEIRVEPRQGRMTLRVTGPEGTQEFLRAGFAPR